MIRPRGRCSCTRPSRSPRTRRGRCSAFGLHRASGPAIYDGDTPRQERTAIRRKSNLVITNPDMLHVGILPHHDAWRELFSNLRYVVVDEAHVYRGVFGSHVGNVLRRLRRIASIHGSDPTFLMTSATIANPVELARAADRDRAVHADRPRRRAEGRAPDRDLESAAARRRARLTRIGPVRGGRGVLRPRRGRGADDLLHEVAQGDRADPASRARPARSRARRAVAPYRAGYTPAQRQEIQRRLTARRPARGRRDRRTRARDRHRRARRGGLRHVSRNRREPQADVGPGRTPRPRAGRLHRRRGRA